MKVYKISRLLLTLISCTATLSTAEEETIMTTEKEEVTKPPVPRRPTLQEGAFWCMEPPFEAMEGVLGATSGYMGGTSGKSNI